MVKGGGYYAWDRLTNLLVNCGEGSRYAWDRLTDLLVNCGEESGYAWDRLTDLLVNCDEGSGYAWDRLTDILVNCGEGSGYAWDRLTDLLVNCGEESWHLQPVQVGCQEVQLLPVDILKHSQINHCGSSYRQQNIIFAIITKRIWLRKLEIGSEGLMSTYI